MERFDPESGQVFREVIVKAKPPSVPWEHQCNAAKPRYTPPAKGAESLYAKAMRKIVCNAHTLEPETLKDVPSSLVQQIWKAVRREHQESLHVWKIFAGSGHGDRSFVHATHLPDASLRGPIIDHFAKITSTSFAWMTDLSLVDLNCSATDLKQLSTLLNLQNLEIYYTKDHKGILVDDQVLQHWALRARDYGVFRHLETVVVLGAPGITLDSFKYLNHFPSLESLLLQNTAISHKHGGVAKSHGWSNTPDGRFRSFLTFRNTKFAYSRGGDGYKHAPLETIKQYIDKRRSENIRYSELPVLTVKFSGRHVRPSMLPLDLNQILCFERDPKLRTSATQEETVSSAITQPKSLISKKKRKLKDGKALHLDSLLQGM